MHKVHENKKDDMILTIFVDQTKIASGHRVYPKAGRHKDKRRDKRTSQKIKFRKEI